MNEHLHPSAAHGFHVRTYRPGDQADVFRLYQHGLLAGQIASNDTGADIDNIRETYLTDSTNHFWVAHDPDQRVLGMIGVAHDPDDHVTEIRRLRVEPSHQSTPIAGLLIETALAHCRKLGALKVVLDTRLERSAAMDLFTRFGFQHTRSKTQHGKELLEFYLDLYRGVKKEGNHPPHGHLSHDHH